MAESPSFKVQIDYKNPENVEAEVPGSQKIREVDSNAEQNSDVGIPTTSDVQLTDSDTLSPVITVTKKEATFTKGDLKLQKVTVTEDIAMEDTQNGGHSRISRSYQTSVHRDGNTITKTISTSENKRDGNKNKGDKTHEEKRSKIPMLKFRQAAERVKNEKRVRKKEDNIEKRPRRSSIPKLVKDNKITAVKETIVTPKTSTEPEDEFEKIYGEIVEDKQKDIDDKILAVNLEDPEKLEIKFEEIIHAYEEDNSADQNVQIEKVQLRERQSKIPGLRRRKVDGDRASNLSVIVDNIRLKNAVRKSQEFSSAQEIEGFTQTRTITTEIYRERSREISSTEEIKPNVTADDMEVCKGISENTMIMLKNEENTREDGNFKEISGSKIDVSHTRSTTNKNIESKCAEIELIRDSIGIAQSNVDSNDNITQDTRNNEPDDTDITRKDDMIKKMKEKYKNHVSTTAEKISTHDTTKVIEKETKINKIDAVQGKITIKYTVDEEGAEKFKTDDVGAVLPKIITNNHISQKDHMIGKRSKLLNINVNPITNVKREVIKTEISNIEPKIIDAVDENKSFDTHKEIVTSVNIDHTKYDNLEDDRSQNKIIKTKITEIKSDGPGGIDKRCVIKTEQITKESIKTGIPVFTKVVRTHSQENGQTVEINKLLEWKSTDSESIPNQSDKVTETHKIHVKKPDLKSIKYNTTTRAADTNEIINDSEDQYKINKNISEQNIHELSDKEYTGTAPTKVKKQVSVSNTEDTTIDVNTQKQNDTIQEVTLLKGNVSRLINRMSYRESKPVQNKSPILKDAPEYGSENEDRIRRLDKMISNFDKIEYPTTDPNRANKEIPVTHKQDIDRNTMNKQIIERKPFNEDIEILKRDDNLSIEDVTILKGNVNRLINKIGSIEEPISSSQRFITEHQTNMEIKNKPNNGIDEQDIKNKNRHDRLSTNFESEIKESTQIDTHVDIQEIETMDDTTVTPIEISNDYANATVNINIDEEKANYVTRKTDKEAEKTILRGNVSSELSKIETTEVKATEIKEDELPKKKTVLSKIAIFENLEANEPCPRSRLSRSENKLSKLVVKDTSINEKPRIVEEILKKHAKIDSEENKEEISKNGTIRAESLVVNEVWNTKFDKERKVQNISVTRDIQESNSEELYDDKKSNSIINVQRNIHLMPYENNQDINNISISTKTDITQETQSNINLQNENSSKTTLATESISDVRANIHFISHENNDLNTATTVESSTDSVRPNIHFMPNEDVGSSTVQTVTTDTHIINNGRPNINFMPNEINNDNYVNQRDRISSGTYIVTDVRPIHCTANDTQNIERAVVINESGSYGTTNIRPNIKYSSSNNKTIGNTDQGMNTGKSSENANEIYERVKTKCVVYERNASTISREISRSESREQSYRIERGIIHNGVKTAEIAGEFKFDASRKNKIGSPEFVDVTRTKEEFRRANSVADADLGDAVKGTVSRLVGRIKSVDFDKITEVKRKISIKEMPGKSSVLEKIALFEGKVTAAKMETSTEPRLRATEKNVTRVITEEEYLQKIAELTSARSLYQKVDEMPKITLSNGIEMPVLAIGTALLDSRLIPHIIGAAIDLGYRAFDCAYIYGNEKEVGKAIQAKIDAGIVRREDLFITSKLWSTFHRPDLVEVACRSSLQNMGLTYFDLFLIHNPMSFKEGGEPMPRIATVLQYSQHDYLDAWYGMEAVLSKGLARSVGVSNFNSSQIQRILEKGRVKPVVNQVECHPYLSQERLHNFCEGENITLSCFGVLGSKGTPAEYKSSLSPVIDDPLVQVMASGLNVTAAQLLIRYQIQSGHNVVVKASTAAHMWDNIQTLNFNITDVQMQALTALNRNKRLFNFIGMGDTHKNYPFLAAF